MVRSKSRSRSQGRDEEGYASDDATVRPFKNVKKKGKGVKSPKKPPVLHYKEGDMVMARWPGSRLYYTATVQQVMADMGQYEVMYENGVVFTVTPKDVYKQGPHKKHNKSADSSNSDDNKDTTAELTEDDEDITTMLVNAAVKMTNKISNNSFKEPTRVSKVSNGSKASKSSRVGRKSPDLFSDDEEHVSVSQRPSVSSRLSTSSRTSRLNKVSFSSTINKLLDSVFTQNGDKKISVNGKSTDLNGVNGDDISGEKIVNGENGEIETDSKVSTSSRASKVSKSKVKKSSSSSKAANTSQRLDEFSEDENGDMSMTAPAVNPAETAAPTLSGYNIEWIISLFFMILCPTILITLHNICTSNVTNLAPPKISLNPVDYFDAEAMIIVLGFLLFLRFCEFVCIGKYVDSYRMNGFQTLLICLVSIPALLAHGVSLSIVTEKYFYLMSSSVIISFGLSVLSYAVSFRCCEDHLTSKGNTGNFVTDIYQGRQLSPSWTGCNVKLQTFRASMIGLALLNVGLVTQSVLDNDGRVNMGVLVAASLQVLYAMDAMFYEEYYFNSADYLNAGYGWSLISSYITFPFLPSLITRYMIHLQPDVNIMFLIITGIVNLLGYTIYRSSETQRCELSRNPKVAELTNLKTLDGAQGRKLIVSGWWGLVRHPNYLGEILVQWSWVLPLAFSIGLKFYSPYYLPLVTTIMLSSRCTQTNNKNRRKYGSAWEDYSRKVKANILPYIY